MLDFEAKKCVLCELSAGWVTYLWEMSRLKRFSVNQTFSHQMPYIVVCLEAGEWIWQLESKNIVFCSFVSSSSWICKLQYWVCVRASVLLRGRLSEVAKKSKYERFSFIFVNKCTSGEFSRGRWRDWQEKVVIFSTLNITVWKHWVSNASQVDAHGSVWFWETEKDTDYSVIHFLCVMCGMLLRKVWTNDVVRCGFFCPRHFAINRRTNVFSWMRSTGARGLARAPRVVVALKYIYSDEFFYDQWRLAHFKSVGQMCFHGCGAREREGWPSPLG